MKIERNILCPECGPDVGIDDECCCAACGATATGATVAARARRLAKLEKVVAAAKLMTDHMLGPTEAMFAADVDALRTALDALDRFAADVDALRTALDALDRFAADVAALRTALAALDVEDG